MWYFLFFTRGRKSEMFSKIFITSTLLLCVSETSNQFVHIFIIAQLTLDWKIFVRLSAKKDALLQVGLCEKEWDGPSPHETNA